MFYVLSCFTARPLYRPVKATPGAERKTLRRGGISRIMWVPWINSILGNRIRLGMVLGGSMIPWQEGGAPVGTAAEIILIFAYLMLAFGHIMRLLS